MIATTQLNLFDTPKPQEDAPAEQLQAQPVVETRMEKASRINRTLCHFTGTESYHIWSALFPNVYMTDGAKYVADECGGHGAYWLMDVIGSVLVSYRKEYIRAGLSVWKLVVTGSSGKVTAENGNGKVLYTQDIPFTDFDLDSITLWVETGATPTPGEVAFVILLPSEH